MPYHSRATANLLPGRISHSAALYFLTWCTHARVCVLTEPVLLRATRAAIALIDSSADGRILAATVMPDHVHVLLELHEQLTLSQIVAKTKATVTRQSSRVRWQRNFFDHRLREPSSAEDFALYIFMNPYGAALRTLDEEWPGWISSDVRWRFMDKLRQGRFPHPKWLETAQQFGKKLPTGAE